MLRKDLCLQYRRKSPSLFKSEFYISRLHLGKGIQAGFPKCSIFHSNIMLRKWSQQSLCFTLKAHPCHTVYSERKTYIAIFLDSLSIVCDKKRRKEWEKLELETASSRGVMILISCAYCSSICGVITLIIIGEWYWIRQSPCPTPKRPLWNYLWGCQPVGPKYLMFAYKILLAVNIF